MITEPYVGLPWRDRGRDRAGLDCWGLVRLVLEEEAGIVLPSYADDYSDTSDREAVAGLVSVKRGPWVAVTPGSERALDLVLIRERPWHIGLVVRRGLMLHMPAEQTSVIEPYTTGRYVPRVEGLYRHISMIERAA